MQENRSFDHAFRTLGGVRGFNDPRAVTLPDRNPIWLAGYWFAGLWVPAVTHYYLISLPAALPAIFPGRFVNHRLRGDSFLVYAHVGLICVGVLLLTQTIR
jgi:hypothetical protein